MVGLLMRIATMQQIGEAKLNHGILPPLKEMLLEIQVNKLINDYLFSSGEDDKATTLNDGNGPLGFKENTTIPTPFNQSWAMGVLQQNAGIVPCVKPARVLNVCHNESPHNPNNLACTEDMSVVVKEQEMGPSNVQISQPISASCEASSVSISMEKEGKMVNSSAQLSRMETFPCKTKEKTPWGAACEADTEVKPSCRKPPRPPRPSKSSSNELGLSLTRCSSDTGVLLQSNRRAKVERRRKVTATSSTNTSIWALVFTLCFAVVMIAQGFWSQGSQILALNGSNTSSSTDTDMKINILTAPQQVKGLGVEGREASADVGLDQSYTPRKVQRRGFIESKRLDPDALSKS